MNVKVDAATIIILVLAVFSMAFLLKRNRNSKLVPPILALLAISFLCYGLIVRERLYPSLLFFLLAGYTAIKSFVMQRKGGLPSQG
jgi:hypothetical protein